MGSRYSPFVTVVAMVDFGIYVGDSCTLVKLMCSSCCKNS